MVLDYLHAGQVDIAFASEPKDKDAYSIRHCFDTHQIFVAAPNYDCDFDHAHTLEEIAAFPLILLERKASSRAYVEQYFQQHGVSLKPEIELGSHNLLISLARIGLGVACVTEEFSQSGLGRGVILPVRTAFEIPPRSVCMCTLRDVSRTNRRPPPHGGGQCAFCGMHKRYGKKQGQFGGFTIDFAHLKRYSSKHQKDAARAAERSLSWPSVIRTTSPSR